MKKGKNFEVATRDAIKQLQGYYAILAMYDGER
jgi:hypothetical protein